MASHEKEVLDWLFASFPNLQALNGMDLDGNKEEDGEEGDLDEFGEGMMDMDEEGEDEGEDDGVEEEGEDGAEAEKPGESKPNKKKRLD